MPDYETIISEVIVKPRDQAIFSEMATRIKLDDEAVGCFVVIEQEGRLDEHKNRVVFGEDEWPHICQAVVDMLEVAKDQNAQQGHE